MKIILFFMLMSFSCFSVAVLAQDDDSETPICKQPSSSKFDEFEFKDLETAKEKLDLFGLQIKNFNTYGVVIAYGGKNSESNQSRSIGFKVEDYITEKFSLYKYVTISVIDGGHREKPTIELFIQPERCSAEPETSPTLSYDEVSYKEENSFFDKTINRKTVEELENLVKDKSEPVYPAAARAVKARGKVLVLAIVNEKGFVTKATAIDGHPLLLATSEIAVRKWQYQIQKENDKPIKFGGKIIIDFDEIAKNLPEPTIDY